MRRAVSSPLTPREVERRVRIVELQDEFLDTYRRTGSAAVACKRAGVSVYEYARWKSVDADFAERLNAITEHWQEELVASVVTRAIGYTAVDDEGNIIVDAEGRVVRHGASDQLAKSLLGLDRPAVQVNILPTVVFQMSGVDDDERPAIVPAHGETYDAGPEPASVVEHHPVPERGPLSTYNASIPSAELLAMTREQGVGGSEDGSDE